MKTRRASPIRFDDRAYTQAPAPGLNADELELLRALIEQRSLFIGHAAGLLDATCYDDGLRRARRALDRLVGAGLASVNDRNRFSPTSSAAALLNSSIETKKE